MNFIYSKVRSFTKKKLLKAFSSGWFFYEYLGNNLFILLSISILVGLLDGFGLSLFLPLLQLVAEDGVVSSGKMGRLDFIIDFIESFGFQINLAVILITMLLFFVFKGIATFFNNYLRITYQQIFTTKIRVQIIEVLTVFSYEKFTKSDIGEIQNTLTVEIQRVIRSYDTYIGMLQQLILVLTYSALAFVINPRFTLLMFAGGLLINVLFRVFYKKTKNLSFELVSQNSDFQNKITQMINFFKYLKSTSNTHRYADKLKNSAFNIENVTKKIGIVSSIVKGMREPLTVAIVVMVILIQVNVFKDGLGTIVISLLIFYRALTAITAVQDNYNKFLGFSGSLKKMEEFIIRLNQNKFITGNKKLSKISGDLSLKEVSFSFDNITNILKNINLNIKNNETIALVGESGSGKTTLVNILVGLLKPNSGTYLINGQDVKDIDLYSFQNRIGYITQEYVIFSDTIFNNVTFWAEKNPENLNKFWEVLKKANLYNFVKSQTYQEDQELGFNGVNLSGGQKQRISIARNLFKDIDILFLDEATSSLDSKTEKEIQHNIFELRGHYTIIIIAHRLSTIKDADRIILMDKGKIDHIGSYEKLIKESNHFSRMVEMQEM